MTEEPTPAKVETGERSAPLSNVERLRAHLKDGGLAAALLASWSEGEPSSAVTRMRLAIAEFFKNADTSDDTPAPSKD